MKHYIYILSIILLLNSCGKTSKSSDETPTANTKSFSNRDYIAMGCPTVLTIPDGITHIADSTFFYNTSIQKIILPQSLTSIGNRAFYSSSISEITLPKSLTSIGDEAFFNCWGIESFAVPAKVNKIGWGALSSCVFGDNFKMESNHFVLYDGFIYNKDMTHLISSYDSNMQEEITLPYTLTHIGNDAFCACPNLKKITIPEGVTYIGDWAFNSKSSITSISLPSSLNYIGEGAFANCSNLKQITIPKSVEIIGDRAFLGCNLENKIQILSDKYLINPDGFIYNKNMTRMVSQYYPLNKSHFTVPTSVTHIGNGAFFAAQNVSYITIPNSVTHIGTNTFTACSSLTAISIPNSVTHIGWGSFSNCSALNSVSLPNSLTSIEDQLFFGCINLQSISLPNNIKKVGNLAFNKCENLSAIILPESVIHIGNSAFMSCVKIKSLIIPASVSHIGYGAFSICDITDNFTSLSKNFIIEDGFVYDNKKQRIISSYKYSDTQQFSIPSSVQFIDNGAFWSYRELTSITIPNSISHIGKWSFDACSNLETINISQQSPIYNQIIEEYPSKVSNIGDF